MVKKHINLSDIAKACGVSVGTVSRALSGDELINGDTRDKISRMAERLGYVPNELARGLQKKFNKIIGLLVPDIMNPFFSQIAKATEEYAIRHDYSVFLCNTNLDPATEKKYIRHLYSYKVAGIIILPVSEDIDTFAKQYFAPKQIVYLAYRPESETAHYVLTDDMKIVSMAARHLADMGHRKIAYLGGGENIAVSTSRHRCFLAVAGELGLEPMSLGGAVRHYPDVSARLLREDILNAPAMPTAFLCYNDRLAVDLLEVLAGLGFRVPDDVSVIGIDDTFISRLPKLDLTTVRQPILELGQLSAKAIIDNAAAAAPAFLRRTLDPPGLALRSSVANLKARPASSGGEKDG